MRNFINEDNNNLESVRNVSTLSVLLLNETKILLSYIISDYKKII
jgi:hypothetical protein